MVMIGYLPMASLREEIILMTYVQLLPIKAKIKIPELDTVSCLISRRERGR
jgi:hypothetical protein